MDLGAVLQALRQRLLTDIKAGTVTGARGVELTNHLLVDIESVLRLPGQTIEELQDKLRKIRGIIERMGPFLGTPSHIHPAPPEHSRRAAMRERLFGLVFVLAQELSQPLQQRSERELELELMRRLFQLDVGVLATGSDAEARGFWPSLCGIAVEVANHARRGHLTLARPIFSGPEEALNVSSILFSGSGRLRAFLADACSRSWFMLLPDETAGPIGQDRWRKMRAAAVVVFDLTVPNGPQLASVCYELGIVLALGKPYVALALAGRPPPFDVDVKTVEVGATPEPGAVIAAIEAAIFVPARGEPGDLPATLAELERELGESGGHGMSKVALDAARAAEKDAVRFKAAVGDVLGLWGPAAPKILLPTWPASYPSERRCFHVMPFSQPWSDEVERIVSRACEGQVEYIRGDRGRDANVLRRIWCDLSVSTHVLVDLTGFNANVSLELGMAHTLGRNTLIVAQEGTIPNLFESIAKLDVPPYPHWRPDVANFEDGGQRLGGLVRSFVR